MGSGAPQKNYTATTKAEFEKLLTDETFKKADVIQVLTPHLQTLMNS